MSGLRLLNYNYAKCSKILITILFHYSQIKCVITISQNADQSSKDSIDLD